MTITSTFSPKHPHGGSIAKQVRGTAECMIDAGKNLPTATEEIVRRALVIAEGLDQKYPKELRTSEGLQEILSERDKIAVFHNSPHYGNTDSRRIADVMATGLASRWLRANPADGHSVIELRTTLDTNNLADTIYRPDILVGIDRTARLAQIDENSAKARLTTVPNLLGGISQSQIEGDAAALSNPKARNLILAALEAIPKQDGYVGASRLWNTAVRRAFIIESGLGSGDFVLDVPFTEWVREDPLVRKAIIAANEKLISMLEKKREAPESVHALVDPQHRSEFLNFLAKEETKLAASDSIGMPTLSAAVNTMLVLNPTVIKGGRSMHMYFAYALAALGYTDGSSVNYIKMAEYNVPAPDRSGIPTLKEATAFGKQTVPVLEDLIRARMEKRSREKKDVHKYKRVE